MIGSLLASCLAFMPLAPDDDLDALLHEHFTARASAKRRSIQKKILATDGLTPDKLAAAIRNLELWQQQTTGERPFTIRMRSGQSSEETAWVHVPDDYDPTRPWPLVVTLHGQGGKAQPMLRMTRQMLGNRADEFIIVAPQDIGPLGFTEPDRVVARPRQLVRGIRRAFQIDNDRIYLLGYSLGSHNTWMATVMHSDLFAGIVPLATPLQVVGETLLYEELLANCRNTAILFCWGKNDTLLPDGSPHPKGGNAATNRILSKTIVDLGFERFEAVEFPDKDHFGVAPPPDKLSELIGQERRRFPTHVHQAYRLVGQSRAYWLQSGKLQGQPLPDGRIDIPVDPREDPRAAHRKYLIKKLGLVEGRIDGQTIRLETRRTGNVILLLSDELIDLDKPVRILRKNRKRFRGRIQRDLRVMLEEAARSWDFDRLYTARVVIPLGGKTKFGYPQKAKKRRRSR